MRAHCTLQGTLYAQKPNKQTIKNSDVNSSYKKIGDKDISNYFFVYNLLVFKKLFI